MLLFSNLFSWWCSASTDDDRKREKVRSMVLFFLVVVVDVVRDRRDHGHERRGKESYQDTERRGEEIKKGI